MIDNPAPMIAALVAALMLSAITGFLVARWLYAARATVRVEILQKEIMRLRRRVSEKGDEKVVTEQQMSRMRRDIKSSLSTPARLIEDKTTKKPASLNRYDRSYGRPPVVSQNPTTK